MATYRSIYITFWSDTKVCDDFTPEDKYFMLYCLTNKYTNLCGCYEISKKQMSLDLGYNIETIDKLLERFSKIHNIIFYNNENKEIYIKNWYKYNWTSSSKLDKPLLEEIKKIKTDSFKVSIANVYNNRDTVSIPYTYHIETNQIPYRYNCTATVSDTESVIISDSNKLKIEKEQKEIIKYYEENVGLITPATAELLLDYLKDMNYELIIEAIKIATLANKRNGRYINGILRDWNKKGYKTLLDLENEKQEKEEKEKNTKIDIEERNREFLKKVSEKNDTE